MKPGGGIRPAVLHPAPEGSTSKMKKLFSIFLILVLCLSLLPVPAPAAEDPFTLSEEELLRARKLAGTVSGSWHEGMSWSDSMNAYQKYCYLTDFRDNTVTPLKNRYVMASRRAEEDPSVETETGRYSLSGIRSSVYTLESKVNYFIFDLETEYNAVVNAETVLNNPDSTPAERSAAYRRISKAVERINEITKELKKGPFPGKWVTEISDMNGQLDAFFEDAVAAPLKSGLLSAPNPDGTSFHVIILNTDQIGIEVRTKDSVAIQGAKVTLSQGDTVKTGLTGSDGVIIFPAGSFQLDDHYRLTAGLKIEKKGYRIWESEALRITAGEALHIQLEEDDGESYVQFATFRGVDVVHDTEHVYYTPANDAVQSFRVGIHTYPGRTGTFTFTYTPAGSDTPVNVTKTVTGTRDGVTVLDLKDTWCAKLAPEEDVSLQYGENGSEPGFVRTKAITTEKAITEKPLKQVTGIPSFIPGSNFGVDIPLNLPGLKSLRISMAFPWDLLGLGAVNFSASPAGTFYLSIGVAAMKKLSEDETDQEGWKTVNSKQTNERYKDFVSGRKSLTDIAMASTRKDGAKSSFMDMFKSKFMASFCVILNGKVAKNPDTSPEADPYAGNMDLFVSASLDAMVSFSSPFMVGPVPCHVGFDLSVGISAGVDIPFTFTAPHQNVAKMSEWNDISFQKEGLDIIISPRVSLSAYAGAGVKGLAGIYIRGFVGMSLNLHIRPMNSQIFSPEVTLNAGIQVVAEFLFFSVRATIWEHTWQFKLNSSANPNTAKSSAGIHLRSGSGSSDADTVHYVTPKVETLRTVENTSNYRTAEMNGDIYAFWIEDKAVEGTVRPWLSCAKIDMSSGSAKFVPVDLPYLYVGKNHDKSLTKDTKVAYFEVTSTEEVPRHEAGFGMITLAVTYYEYSIEMEFPNRKIENDIYSVEFYNIVFYDSGLVSHYPVRADSLTTQVMNTSAVNGSVSIAFDEKVGKVSESDHDEYFYYLTYTLILSDAPTTVHYGVASVYLTPDRPAAVLETYGFQTAGKRVSSVNFDTPAHPLDDIIQVYGIARGMGTHSNDLYVLGTLTGQTDADGNPVTALIARDGEGDFDRQVYEESVLTGDINSFRYIPGSQKEAGLFALVSSRDETGRFALSLTDHRFGSDGRPRFTSPRDLGVRIGPAHFDLVDLGGSRALYYLETVSSDPSGGDGYNIRAIYLSEGNDGQLYASHSFHLAVFDPKDASVDTGISYLKLYDDGAGFIQGFMLERIKTGETVISKEGNIVKYTDSRKSNLKRFTFRQTLQAEVLDATPEQVLVKPGDTINVLFTLMNTGNIPASKITLRAYALKDGSKEQINLASILVNCEDPTQSRVTPSDSSLPVLRGYEAVSGYSSDHDMDTFAVSQSGSTDVYATEVLMPDETHQYRTTFRVPDDFVPGYYEIYVTFSEMYTRVLPQGGRYDAVSAWSKMLYNADTQTYRDVLPGATGPGSGGRPVSVGMSMAAPMLGPGSSDDNDMTVKTVWHLDDEESGGPLMAGENVMSRLSTTAVNDRNPVPIGDADLSVEGRLTREAGSETVHIVVRNEGMSGATGISVTAAVDGKNTYSQSFSGVTLAYRNVISYDVPLDTVTGGKTGESLVLEVNGRSVETNTYNNSSTLPLNTDFAIITQPEDVFVTEKKNASFTVKTRGGKEPLTYQWQVSQNGRSGAFRNIEGAADRTLSLTGVPYSDNGNYYRVIITDADGRRLTSNPALMVVKKLPPTGDSADPLLWTALTGTSLLTFAAAVFLRKRKRSL